RRQDLGQMGEGRRYTRRLARGEGKQVEKRTASGAPVAANVLLVLLTGVIAATSAQEQQQIKLATRLNEQVVMLQAGGIELETTIFKPDGEGPFPLVVINHGKASGNPYFQPRYRPLVAARQFVDRGYLVAVPMRQGFSKSGGGYVNPGC